MRMMRIDEEPEKEEAEARADIITIEENFGMRPPSEEVVSFISECQDCKRTVKFIQTKGECWGG